MNEPKTARIGQDVPSEREVDETHMDRLTRARDRVDGLSSTVRRLYRDIVDGPSEETGEVEVGKEPRPPLATCLEQTPREIHELCEKAEETLEEIRQVLSL